MAAALPNNQNFLLQVFGDVVRLPRGETHKQQDFRYLWDGTNSMDVGERINYVSKVKKARLDAAKINRNLVVVAILGDADLAALTEPNATESGVALGACSHRHPIMHVHNFSHPDVNLEEVKTTTIIDRLAKIEPDMILVNIGLRYLSGMAQWGKKAAIEIASTWEQLAEELSGAFLKDPQHCMEEKPQLIFFIPRQGKLRS